MENHIPLKALNGDPTIENRSISHFYWLDGLRGLAAFSVLWFHLMEAFSLGDPFKQTFNHGYLAVDFFFLLSGYIVSHSYDHKWNQLTIKSFAKRRITRLHPMVLIGMVLGLLFFYAGASSLFPKIVETPWSTLVLVFLWGSTLLPLPVQFDVRGWGEMHPLNGPAWSLFFEYLANAFYAIFLRKISIPVLAMLTLLAAGALLEQTLLEPRGDVVGGWSLEPGQLRIGLTRLAFPFLAGILLRRSFNPLKIKFPYLVSGSLLMLTFSVPRIGGDTHTWMNGLFESLAILYVFPFILLVGAGTEAKSNFNQRACQFLGRLSYPLYITHYPLMYVFTAWVHGHNLSLQEGWLMAIACGLLCTGIAIFCQIYLEPPLKNQFKKWLS
jgi:peptidoglycan/LPS O-acetylase OafA/YrhL